MALIKALRNRLSASVRRKILLVFALGIVFPILVTAWLSYRTSEEAMNRQSLDEQNRLMAGIAREISTLEDHSRRQLEALGADAGLREGIRHGQVRESVIQIFLKVNPSWRNLRIRDWLGRELWPTASPNIPPVVDSFFLETFISRNNQKAIFQANGTYLTEFGLRLDEPNRFLGVVSASLDLSPIQLSLRKLRFLSSTKALLWDDRGVVFGSNLDSKEVAGLLQVVSLTTTGQEVLKDSSKTIHRRINLSGEDNLFSATVIPEYVSPLEPSPGQDWFVGILTPESEAFSSLRSFRWKVLVFLVLLFSAVGLAFVWVGRRIANPLRSMAVFASQVADGERTSRLPVTGKDEVAILGDSLNRMTDALGEYEQQLIRTESLASLGRMSSVMAHEIRHPLNTVKGSVQYLQLKFPDEPVVQEYTEMVVQKVDHLARFVESLLRLGRLPKPDLRTVVAADLVGRACHRFQARCADQGVALSVVAQECVVRVDEDQLIELIQNVVANCLDAMLQGGRLSIDVSQVDGNVHFRFSDDGPGIPKELQSRLFVPFVTSKRNGIGLGLVLCRMVAENHRGEFVYVPTETGACFLLKLPCS